MIRATSIAALTAALTLGAALPAMAQVTKPIGLSLRAGVAWPTNNNGSNNTFFAAGLDYKIANFGMQPMTGGMNAYYGISVDYIGKDSVSSIPVTLTVTGRENEFFYTVGAGVAFNHVGGANSTDQSQFAYTFGIGYDFASGATPFFLEAKYFGSTNTKLSGIGVYAGIRF